MTDPFQLLRETQAANRLRYAQNLQAQQEATQGRQQFAGTYLGIDADQACAFVQVDGRTDPIPCEVITTGNITIGQTVLVTIPAGANRGYLNAMPR